MKKRSWNLIDIPVVTLEALKTLFPSNIPPTLDNGANGGGVTINVNVINYFQSSTSTTSIVEAIYQMSTQGKDEECDSSCADLAKKRAWRHDRFLHLSDSFSDLVHMGCLRLFSMFRKDISCQIMMYHSLLSRMCFIIVRSYMIIQNWQEHPLCLWKPTPPNIYHKWVCIQLIMISEARSHLDQSQPPTVLRIVGSYWETVLLC